MIYVQLRARVKLAQGETLHVADAAKVLGSEKAGHCSLFCPTAPGVYTLDAIAVAKALKKVFPQEDISLIGADVCYVHRIKARGKDFLRPVRTAAALLILLLGSALGLTWFHADVNMPQAQADVYAAITGAPPDDVHLITIPYCVGVALGVCVFYAIPFPHQTTPLEVKLTEYQEDMEKAEGKPIELRACHPHRVDERRGDVGRGQQRMVRAAPARANSAPAARRVAANDGAGAA